MSHIIENTTWHVEKLLLHVIQAMCTKSYRKISGKDTRAKKQKQKPQNTETDLNF